MCEALHRFSGSHVRRRAPAAAGLGAAALRSGWPGQQLTRRVGARARQISPAAASHWQRRTVTRPVTRPPPARRRVTVRVRR